MAEKDEPRLKPRTPRRTRSGPTIADVAKAAGVSLMTVSRVINRESGVRAQTRQRVDAAVIDLGYVPNSAARSLAGGRQTRIALLYGNPSAAFLSEFLVGTLDAAAEHDAELVIERWPDNGTIEEVVRQLERRRMDAVLLPPPLCDNKELLAALAARGLQVAQVATGSPAPGAWAVSIDDLRAAREITDLLLGLGHRRIGFIGGDPDLMASRLRRAGYEQALEAVGHPLDPAIIAEGDFTYRSGLAAARVLLSAEPRPTAIFACNDDMAAATVAVAHGRGLDVPGDLSVCGFDDTALATTIWPELTTIRQPIRQMARQAASILIAAVRGEPDPAGRGGPHLALEYELVQRGSHGAPTAT